MTFTYSPCLNCQKINKVPLDPADRKQPICGHCKSELPLHGAVSEVNGTGLKTLVEKSPVPVIADFWAPWCGPCRVFAPTFESAARQLAGRAVLVKVNTEANPLAGDAFAIRSIPTLIAFNGGLEKARQSGALSLPAFLSWAQSVTA